MLASPMQRSQIRTTLLKVRGIPSSLCTPNKSFDVPFRGRGAAGGLRTAHRAIDNPWMRNDSVTFACWQSLARLLFLPLSALDRALPFPLRVPSSRVAYRVVISTLSKLRR